MQQAVVGRCLNIGFIRANAGRRWSQDKAVCSVEVGTMELISNTTSGASVAAGQTGYELRFQDLHREGRALSFACNGQGEVDLDSLSERARSNYLYARAMMGCEYGLPTVMRTDL